MTAALMYHELERAGRPLAQSDPGYVRYVVEEPDFEQHLSWIVSEGLRGVGLGRALASRFSAPGEVVITFDDGCETDWLVAAPHLIEHGFGATFYVVSDWIDRREGFLTSGNLRSLSDAGFEIGSHSQTHAFLTDLGDGALARELLDSKLAIEDMIGRPVAHLSCPGGRANRKVMDAARAAGYQSMATSRVGANDADTDPFSIARCALLRNTPLQTFKTFCRADSLGALQMRDRALAGAKALLGNRLYTSLRNAVLR